MANLNSTGPLWKRAADASTFPRLEADLSVDVAVVGGGITGVTAALLLAEAGQRVALLEGRQIAAGVTGHTTAHLTEAIDLRYHRIEGKFGRDAAKLVRESSRAAIEKIATLSSSCLDGCEFKRLPGYLFAADAAGVAEIETEREAAKRAGAEVDLGVVPLSLAAGPGLCFRNQARIDPVRYVGALAQKVPRASAHVFERTQVVEIEPGEPCRLRLEHGPTVSARAIVLATHAPFSKVSFQLKISQYRSYALAGPLADFPEALFWDTQDPYHYLRPAIVGGQRQLIIGGEDHKTGKAPDGPPDQPFTNLRAYAATLGMQPNAYWSAQVVESVDGLPFIGPPAASEPVHVATGFAGNGMTFGTLAAMMLTDALLGVANPYAELYRAGRFKPLASLGSVVSENVDFPTHLVTDPLHASERFEPANLAAGDGCVVRVDGARLAVYRDQGGRLHALSAICTHLGCQVAFNSVERSWDCPCHGSRFDIDGAVLDGPATKPLERRQL